VGTEYIITMIVFNFGFELTMLWHKWRHCQNSFDQNGVK